ncbi:MAG TPA: hypothetical protein DEA08_35760 [Planctomycetes bacterium]|nr:hypothetical protein [Planctomycetota bacterium]|tara:strand:- start:257 stop:541 length:285 start_codon:yes stop_codon:yes gene_type:complete
MSNQTETENAPRRFTPGQLARLLEVSSTIKCECPNHLARIVQSLIGFEDYAKDCENLNEEDARIHRMLYEKTVRARVLLDEALAELCDFEQISV